MTPTITADATDTKQISMYQAAMQADTMWIEPPVARFLAYQELSTGGTEMLNLPQDLRREGSNYGLRYKIVKK